jgi:hypothetical protein
VFEQVQFIRFVRIISAELDGSAPLECRFKYRTEVLTEVKGKAPLEFYLAEPAVVGSRYLLMGNVGQRCGERDVSLAFPTTGALHPIFPYAFNRADSRSWIAFGGSNFTFPPGIEVVEGLACYIPAKDVTINPCLTPPPVENLMEFKKQLESSLWASKPVR